MAFRWVLRESKMVGTRRAVSYETCEATARAKGDPSLGNAIDAIVHSLSKTAKRTRAWFPIDREGDAQHVLEKLVESGALFLV